MLKRAIHIAVLVLALSLLAVPGALADEIYSDPAGDSGSAPDITAMGVSNDDMGNITFAITTNQPNLAPDTSFFGFIDTDVNAMTGMNVSGLGADVFFIADADGGVLFEVVGNLLLIGFNSTLSVGYSAGTLTARVNRSDLDDTERFAFLVQAEQTDADGDTIASDMAPDGAPFFEYSLSEALTLTLGKPVSASGKPVAGRPFTIAVPVTRSDGQPFAGGNVACRMKIGLTPIRAVGRIAAGSARCTARIPKNVRGKTLRGTMTVSTADAGPVMKAFAFKIV